MAALRASYHRILDRVEHLLPAKLRPLYNHPAGNAELVITKLPDQRVLLVMSASVQRWWVTDPSCGASDVKALTCFGCILQGDRIAAHA